MSTSPPPAEFEPPHHYWVPQAPPTVSPERRRRNRLIAIIGGITGGFLVLAGASIAGVVAYSLVSDNLQQQHSSQGDNGPYTNSGGDSDASTLNITDATAKQKVGVVTIVTVLNYDDQSSAAGTGIILSSDGEILTNNHVIEGSTSIEVTIESTGDVYTAEVVGTDSTNDVAVLQLVDAKGLKPMKLDEKTDAAVNDEVASIGNANGTGNLVVAAGRISRVGENLTIGGDSGDKSEHLLGLIAIDADVVSGDSGGPLVNPDGEVVGMVTAASSGQKNISGYAITIRDAMKIVRQIRSGEETDTVRIGGAGFMGVLLADAQGTGGVTLQGTVADSPAEHAGMGAGDVIVMADNVTVSSVDELTAVVRAHDPGETITIVYNSSDGQTHTIDIVLVAGPAV